MWTFTSVVTSLLKVSALQQMSGAAKQWKQDCSILVYCCSMWLALHCIFKRMECWENNNWNRISLPLCFNRCHFRDWTQVCMVGTVKFSSSRVGFCLLLNYRCASMVHCFHAMNTAWTLSVSPRFQWMVLSHWRASCTISMGHKLTFHKVPSRLVSL